jgi:acyl carrier protein
MIEKIIAESLGLKVDSIKDESNFVNDLGADSLNIVEIVMAIEEEFDVEIPDEDAETLYTVGELKQYIEDNS